MNKYKIIEGITKYTFGNPILTEAVIIKGEKIEIKDLEYFQVEIEGCFRLKYEITPDDIVLGLGESERGMNKRGGVYESYCTDDPIHTPDKRSLYGAHNFVIVDGSDRFGVFVDYPGKVVFDIGFTHKDILEITVEDDNLDLYIIKGEDIKSIVRKFLKIIGKSYVAPKWAFGYQQSRWSYSNKREVEEVAYNLIKHDIPCDCIYLDIDYMEDFKDFTVSEERFPDFKNFVKKMKDKGFRLIPIIDAGVKIEEGYEIYEEGIEKGYFCTDKEGNPFVAAVWPGKVHFPDFLNEDARRWFGRKYKILIDWGIEGFWNDMNEPSIFYTEKGLEKAIEKAKESQNKNLDVYAYFELRDCFLKLLNGPENYKDFYHNFNGQIINHHKVHNLYGFNMTRAASEGFEEIEPNKRFLIFSRSSYIGMHRYGGIWTGDNYSWWEHILLNIKMMPSLNMCGFLYCGADTGGFGGNSNAHLVIRWTQFSLFTPLFRNHSALETRNQEPYAFDWESTDILRKVIRLRYALLPYIYSEYMKAAINDDVYFSPLLFEYNDKYSRRVEDQLLVGDSLMIAPIYVENSFGRYVWLPEDMLLWKASNHKERSYEIIKKGHTYIDVNINEVPIFIRKNKMLILCKPASRVEDLDLKELDVLAFVDDIATYIYYDDDGITYDFQKGIYSQIHITIERVNNDYKITVKNMGNKKVKMINFEIADASGEIHRKTVFLNN